MTTSLTYTWTCAGCNESGEGERSNAASDKHMRATGHCATVRAVPSISTTKKD